MQHHAFFHCGLDCLGNRHRRMKATVVVRAVRHHAALFPRVVVVGRASQCRQVWRTGLQQARWQALNQVLRAERRSFLSTLPRRALVPQVPTRFG